jgi:hypothetical protein
MYKRTDVVSTQSLIFYPIKNASIINTSFEYDHTFSQNSKAVDLFSVDLHACSYVASEHTQLYYPSQDFIAGFTGHYSYQYH